MNDETSRVVWHRLRTFYASSPTLDGFRQPVTRCRTCNCRSKFIDIRDTPAGSMCLACYLDWPDCEVCGVGAAVVIFDYQKLGHVQVCADCLNQDVPPELTPYKQDMSLWDLQMSVLSAGY